MITLVINTPGSQVSFAVVKQIMYVVEKVVITADTCPV